MKLSKVGRACCIILCASAAFFCYRRPREPIALHGTMIVRPPDGCYFVLDRYDANGKSYILLPQIKPVLDKDYEIYDKGTGWMTGIPTPAEEYVYLRVTAEGQVYTLDSEYSSWSVFGQFTIVSGQKPYVANLVNKVLSEREYNQLRFDGAIVGWYYDEETPTKRVVGDPPIGTFQQND